MLSSSLTKAGTTSQSSIPSFTLFFIFILNRKAMRIPPTMGNTTPAARTSPGPMVSMMQQMLVSDVVLDHNAAEDISIR
ncbi:hypothetical protein HYFRA_00013970 [Hymenoscyphus fraxineus]|uniref:Uncharacterized protein n=1 Tax=Hymenoscyphus fraxineus TaxID=746836 RepID=A0A9N9PVN0_9HELO|nr:hypothetical protein HYFRA_00013970 [Hymenoscyphus fraxineus]